MRLPAAQSVVTAVSDWLYDGCGFKVSYESRGRASRLPTRTPFCATGDSSAAGTLFHDTSGFFEVEVVVQHTKGYVSLVTDLGLLQQRLAQRSDVEQSGLHAT